MSSFKIDKLTPSNYPVWRCIIESILFKANIDINTKAAAERTKAGDGKLEDAVNYEALSIIRTGVSREIIPIIAGEQDAVKTWIILENRFAAIDVEARWEK